MENFQTSCRRKNIHKFVNKNQEKNKMFKYFVRIDTRKKTRFKYLFVE